MSAVAIELSLVQDAERRADDTSEMHGLYLVHLFKESGKWAYTAYIFLEKPEHWVDFIAHIDAGMDATPAAVRGVSLAKVPEGWSAVMPSSPWGFPVLAVGR